MIFKVSLEQKPIVELHADNVPCVCGSRQSTLHIYYRISKAALLMSSTRPAAKLICNNCGKIVPIQKWTPGSLQLAAEQKLKYQTNSWQRYQSVFLAGALLFLVIIGIVVYILKD